MKKAKLSGFLLCGASLLMFLLLSGMSCSSDEQDIKEKQESYLPVFGDDMTAYFVGGRYSGSNTKMHVYYSWRGQEVGVYDMANMGLYANLTMMPSQLRVSAGNAKLWSRYGNDEEHLIMDLDMNVGDVYTDPLGNKHTVTNVYEKNGRKHIEFNFSITLEFGAEPQSPAEGKTLLVFIEGIGPNVFLEKSSNWVLAQYKSGVLSYGLPEWEDYWQYILP